MNNINWVKIYSTNQIQQPEIIKSIFEEANIPCSSIDKKDSSYIFGEIEIYVPEENVTEAITILKEHQIV
ncbi:MAG: hypothetical protein RL516_875 [Bacteroidota bacterium]|jgi:type III secretory pathway lipoprotein EscJ